MYPLLAESADSLNQECDWRGFIYLGPVVVGVGAPTPPLKAGVPISSTEAEPPYIRKLRGGCGIKKGLSNIKPPDTEGDETDCP